MFNQLLRTVPGGGRLIVNAHDAELKTTLEMGCWTPRENFAIGGGADWSAHIRPGVSGRFTVSLQNRPVGELAWDLLGEHNVMNALAAIAAARQAGVTPEQALQALREFRGVKRRMEIRGVVGDVTVYDDFAHHPTAIDTTLRGLRARVGAARIIAVLEPRSNTMKMGVHRDHLAPSLTTADLAWFYSPADLGWDLKGAVASMGERARFADDVDTLASELANEAQAGDHILIMSNGGFGGLHEKLLLALKARQ
jgi:UDP-N-acetylmuramate: L-alanyl-gamma-D-glutamyl-meso-diaminopimelate ligase